VVFSMVDLGGSKLELLSIAVTRYGVFTNFRLQIPKAPKPGQAVVARPVLP